MNDLSVLPRDRTIRRSVSISPKITQQQLQLDAALYIRQSTSAQLREHQESTARQYALQDRLRQLGWADDQVVVIDEDLGISGCGSADRAGFRRLLKLITDQRVGIVIGLEMSRLARNSKDWSDLFEVCAIFRTLIADEDGVFDPQDPNDRLLLGLKGIIAEMELHTMKVRLERGRLNKAQRGEMFHDVPVGYMLDQNGLPMLDPDESARHVMKMFFDLFETIGSSFGVFRHLVEHNIRLPFRDNRRDLNGRIHWRLPSVTTVYGMLKHPLYAGAFGYGRNKIYRQKPGKRQGKKHLPPEEWKVLIKDRHPAYITWKVYEAIQQRLSDNDNVKARRGAPRQGSALLTGIVHCTHCGCRLSPSYPRNTLPVYGCGRHRRMIDVAPCNSSIRCPILDQLVEARLLEVLSPAGVELSLRVIEDETSRRTELDRLHQHRVQQTRYAVDDAERRYRHVDPANRLVATQLERDWEQQLAEYHSASAQLQQFREIAPVRLSDAERTRLCDVCQDVTQLWHSADLITRKQIIRLLLNRIDVDVQDNSELVHVTLHWSGGYQSVHEIRRTVQQYTQLDHYQALISRALELTLSGMSAPKAAKVLAHEGFHCPRHQRPLSADMVKKILHQNEMANKQLTSPDLKENQWLARDLANQLGMPEKQLKDWVTRGWATAIQRPHGRVWVIYANDEELRRLGDLRRRQTGQGSPPPPKELRTPASIPR